MIREIKFRAWDKIVNEMHYSDFVINSKGKCSWWFYNEDNTDTEIDFENKLNNVILMQFTGLKDKNGKEIFEGDIITWFADRINKKAIVEWRFNGYVAKRFDRVFSVESERYFGFQSFIPIKEDKFDGEVIGNIYERLRKNFLLRKN